MKVSFYRTAKAKLLLVFLVLSISLIALDGHLSLSAYEAQGITPYPTYPTNYPLDKQTLETRRRQTQQAAALTPRPSGTYWSFPDITNTPDRDHGMLEPATVTPAGNGSIVDSPNPALGKIMDVNILNSWYEDIGSIHITVFAGSAYDDSTIGAVYKSIYWIGDYEMYEMRGGGLYFTPGNTGAVHIVGAEGERLVLLTEQGKTLYFDVPGEQFITSLEALVPTVTPWPSLTHSDTLTPPFTDDAPNRPRDVDGLSPIDTDLDYRISPSGDEDWFRFHLSAMKTIEVSLDNLPANYDLFIYSSSRKIEVGKSTHSGNLRESVLIQNAPSDDYYARVVGVNGASEPTYPYQLRFRLVLNPKPAATLVSR